MIIRKEPKGLNRSFLEDNEETSLLKSQRFLFWTVITTEDM